MIQSCFDFAQQSAPRPKKTAPRRPAQPAPPDPFPIYRETQATIKALRFEINRLHLLRAESAAREKAAGNQLARMMKQSADAQKRQSALSLKISDLEQRNRRHMNAYYDLMVSQTGKTAIPNDMLRRLTMLAHPDRHNSSEASVTATQWLLQQR